MKTALITGAGNIGRGFIGQIMYEAGYRAFSLLTDDFRLAAVKTYLDLGWKPWLYLDDMEGRWRALAEKFNRDFDSLGCLPPESSFPNKKS